MTKFRNRVAVLLCSTITMLANVNAEDIFPLFTDVVAEGASFETVTFFADAPGFGVDDTALDGTNDILVYSLLDTPMGNGMGWTISASNGENGVDSTEAGENVDVPNPIGLSSAIAAVNGGGRIQNGNAFRLSAWMRQDPNAPITAVPQIQPVLKVEVWKEADSGNADFAAADYPEFGDRIWDTDQNGGSALHVANGQSQASWVDLDNSGETSFSKPVAQSLVTDEWRLVETTLVIDDNPENGALGWGIGGDFMTVADIEEIRGVMYSGDFEDTNFAGGAGSLWVDNILFEVFTDEASLMASPNANPMPGSMSGLACDADGDMDCDIQDLDMLYDAFGSAGALDLNGSGTVDSADIGEWLTLASADSNPAKGDSADVYQIGDVNLSGSVDSTDLGLLLNNFGDATSKKFGAGNLNGDANVDSTDLGLMLNNFGFGAAASTAAVPEPSSFSLVFAAMFAIATLFRSRR